MKHLGFSLSLIAISAYLVLCGAVISELQTVKPIVLKIIQGGTK